MRISYILIVLLTGTGIISVVADYGGMLEVETDLPGASLYLDGTYLGTSPQSVLDVYPGTHRLMASVSDYPNQTRNITISAGASEKIFFTFNKDENVKKPDMITTSECVDSPATMNISGTSVNMIRLPDGSVVSYFTGPGPGITCAKSQNLKDWQQYPDSCLVDDNPEMSQEIVSNPWVFKATDGGYRMIYQKKDGDSPGFFSARSQDGVHFTYEKPISFGNNNSDQTLFLPINSPTGVTLPDGRMRMYYSNQGGIMSAVSGDGGLNWIHEEGARLTEAADPSAFLLPNGEVGLFYIDLAPNLKGQKIWFLSSGDGINFSSSKAISVLESRKTGVWLLDPDIYISSGGEWDLFFNVIGGTRDQEMFALPSLMKVHIDSDCLLNRSASH